ncbi:cytochrome p450 cyp736a12, partial [Phtheirospermum japonicum]
KKNFPPGPRSLPILGHFHLLGKNPHQDLHSLARKHGPIMGLRFGSSPTIVVSSPRHRRARPQNARPRFCQPARKSGQQARVLRAEKPDFREVRAVLARHAKTLHIGATQQPQDQPVPGHETG